MSEPEQNGNGKKVIIVGGGLAGLAAAHGLLENWFEPTLIEARQSLGGRAGSYRDAETGELIDHCQHVAMGCCTNFLHLCERTGCGELLERHRRLHFFSVDGQRSDFAAASWLPAPLHLGPALFGMKHLSWRDKLCISRAMFALMRMKSSAHELNGCTLEWLQSQKQTEVAIERFWKVVLISALADSLDNIPLSATRNVFVDGFLAHRAAADVLIPRASLGELYDRQIAHWLTKKGVTIRLGEPTRRLSCTADNKIKLQTSTGEYVADCVVLAVPWRHVTDLLDESLAASIPLLPQLAKIQSSPISSVHLWTDRPIMRLPHAVLIDRLSQWVFAREDLNTKEGHYYQVVISASRELSGRPKQAVVEEVWSDLQAVFPDARAAQLRSSKLITQREAVFCEASDDQLLPRLPQRTNHPGLVLAGDWTDTGWPATMEGAVRSGYLAAQQVHLNLWPHERPSLGLQPDLPRGWLARLLIR
jgi:squalene-associated FAD-dependent desaturase